MRVPPRLALSLLPFLICSSGPLKAGPHADDAAHPAMKEPTPLVAESVQLVADVNRSDLGSYPDGFARLGDFVYFAAGGDGIGRELWRTDGTADGTTLVADVVAGATSSSPTTLTVFDEALYFCAQSPLGVGLYVSDGTEPGTHLVKDLGPGGGSTPQMAVAGTVLFVVDAARRLWRSDGTEAGTVQVAPSTGEVPSVSSLAAANGLAYFSGFTTATGYELWRSDGSADGTFMVFDVSAGASDGVFQASVLVAGSRVLFVGYDITHGAELWTTDGTTAGTSLLLELMPGASSSVYSDLTVMGGVAYFVGDDAVAGRELCSSDGTPAGTSCLDVIAGSSGIDPATVAAADGRLYLVATGGVSGDLEPWTSDGTIGGTFRLKDIESGPLGSSPQIVGTFGSKLLFTTGDSLWASDGTTNGTVIIAGPEWQAQFPTQSNRSHRHGPSAPVSQLAHPVLPHLNGATFFGRYDYVNGRELWSTTGDPATTGLVADLLHDESQSHSNSKDFFEADGGVYFSAFSAGSGNHLWVSTPGSGVATELKVGSRNGGSSPRILGTVGNRLIFEANDGVTGWELWVTEGTVASTHQVIDLNPAGDALHPYLPRCPMLGGRLLVPAFDAAGFGLYLTDGTATWTTALKQLEPPDPDQSPDVMVPLGSSVIFAASDGTHGQELWQTDGTTIGTQMLKDIWPGVESSAPTGFAVMNGVVYFAARDADHGAELWRSDGTAAGTSLVIDLVPGPNASDPGEITAGGSRLLFTATNSFRRLYGSDGSAAGTARVSDDGYPMSGIVAVGQMFYFSLGDGLYRTSGIPGTVVRVASQPMNFGIAAMGHTVFFHAASALWATRGTLASTHLVADFSATGYPTLGNLTASGSHVYFGADDGVHGQEPYIVTPATDTIVPGDFTGDGSADFSVYRPSSGSLYVSGGSSGVIGAPGDIVAAGEYNGLPGIDAMVFRPSTGAWIAGGAVVAMWGAAGDVPVPADYDGDGLTDVAVFRPWTGQWFVRGHTTRVLGQAGDIALPGDYTGDGLTDLAVYRPSTGAWYVDGRAPVVFGVPSDVPVPADYDGNGTIDLAVYRPATGTWYVRGQLTAVWGTRSDIPLPLDTTGDGRAELVVWRPATGTWYRFDPVSQPSLVTAYGQAGDVPVGVPPQLATGRAFDIDGDRRADPGVYRSSSGTTYVLRSSTGLASYTGVTINAMAAAVPGDYDGDRRMDVATTFDGLAWTVRTSSTGFASGITVNIPMIPSDILVPADYDGDGKTDVAVFNAGSWAVKLAATGFTSGFTRTFGLAGDLGIPADYDGDGRADLAVFRPSNRTWYVARSSGGSLIRTWGLATDIPIARDFDGDRRADLAVYRGGLWFVLPSVGGWTTSTTLPLWGTATDIPVVADYDGDGRADQAVFRPATGTWFVRGQYTVHWGQAGDIPLPRAVN